MLGIMQFYCRQEHCQLSLDYKIFKPATELSSAILKVTHKALAALFCGGIPH